MTNSLISLPLSLSLIYLSIYPYFCIYLNLFISIYLSIYLSIYPKLAILLSLFNSSFYVICSYGTVFSCYQERVLISFFSFPLHSQVHIWSLSLLSLLLLLWLVLLSQLLNLYFLLSKYIYILVLFLFFSYIWLHSGCCCCCCCYYYYCYSSSSSFYSSSTSCHYHNKYYHILHFELLFFFILSSCIIEEFCVASSVFEDKLENGKKMSPYLFSAIEYNYFSKTSCLLQCLSSIIELHVNSHKLIDIYTIWLSYNFCNKTDQHSLEPNQNQCLRKISHDTHPNHNLCYNDSFYVCVLPKHSKNSTLNLYTRSLHHRQDVTQGQFLSGVQLVWNQSFLIPRLVSLPRLKNSIFPTTYW